MRGHLLGWLASVVVSVVVVILLLNSSEALGKLSDYKLTIGEYREGSYVISGLLSN